MARIGKVNTMDAPNVADFQRLYLDDAGFTVVGVSPFFDDIDEGAPTPTYEVRSQGDGLFELVRK